MAWTNANSSMIAAHNYDPDTKVLHIRFRGGQVYSYADVPPDVAAGMSEADSVGRYYHQAIKDKFSAL